jgi:uncharacterized delta-60 repeat protein
MNVSRFNLQLLSPIAWAISVFAVLNVTGCGDDDESGGADTGGSSATGGESTSGGAANSGGKTNAGGTSGSATAGEAGNASGAGAGGTPEAGAGGAPGSPEGGSAGGSETAIGGAGGSGGDVGAGGAAADPLRCTAEDSNSAKKLLELSPNTHDGLFGLTFDADGNIYATGYVADGIGNAENRRTVVTKLDETGALVTGFGNGGIASIDVVNKGAGEMPRGIVLQSDGKIVVSGTVEHDATATGVFANDRDVYVLRLNTDGSIDSSFGDGGSGVKILNLNDGVEGMNAQGQPTLLGADAQWGLNVDSNDRLLVHSAQRAVGFQTDGTTPRTDTDWAIVRLTKDGAVDTAFAQNGKFTYDIGEASASVRTLTLLPDNSLITTGYSTYSGVQRPVLFKLGPDGEGPSWVFSEPVGTAAEAYAAALQSNGKLVTAGYGRPNAAATSSDFVSIRLNASGTLDTSYGSNGARWLDVGGFGDNARTVAVLGDDRVLLAGGGRLTADDTDGAVAILTSDGAPDTTFAPAGCRTYDFGSPGDFFWAAALSPDKKIVAIVGITGVPANSTLDNDSTLLLLQVE